MKWFEGTIPEAITTSKAKKAVFVVFIEGKDDTSKEVASSLDTADVSSRLESEKFVAIKLQSDSENYTFFAQIYQLVPVPSIFFIGGDGAPIEIICNALPAADLANKIDSILEKVNPQAKGASKDLIEAEKKVHSLNSSENTDKSQEKGTNSETADSKESSKNSSDNDTAITSAPSEEEAIPETPLTAEEQAAADILQEEKIKRARELIELQKKKKQEEDERKEREREIERRRSGKDLQKLRQQQQDKEIREAQQERLKERQAEAAAREKILKQIAEDKLERKRKHDMQLQENNAQQQKQKLQEDAQTKAKAQAASVDMSKTRIQFKLPTGNNITGTFDSTNTLGTLRSYVVQNAQLPFRQFSMSAFFPRKDFTSSDDDKTLLELDLAPSSVILILPIKSNDPTSVVKSTDSAGIFSHFFWTLLAPVVSMYNYIMGYFTGRPRAGETDDNNENRNSGNSGITENASDTLSRFANVGLRRLGSQETTKIRSRGNIHTLHSSDNDNDENNTWNGNSTQQM